MDTQLSAPSRVHTTERRDAVVTDERINTFAFQYFIVALLLSAVAAGWAILTI